jgi:hypothetical protein
MWVYDGEEWFDDSDAGGRKQASEDPRPAEQFYPELQIVEVPLIRERLPEPPPLMIVP